MWLFDCVTADEWIDRSQFFNLILTFIEKKNEILLRTFIIFISFRYYTLNNDRKLNLLD